MDITNLIILTTSQDDDSAAIAIEPMHTMPPRPALIESRKCSDPSDMKNMLVLQTICDTVLSTYGFICMAIRFLVTAACLRFDPCPPPQSPSP